MEKEAKFILNKILTNKYRRAAKEVIENCNDGLQNSGFGPFSVFPDLVMQHDLTVPYSFKMC